MRNIVYACLLCLLVMSTLTVAQRGRSRKNKGKNCHLKEVDKCFDNIEKQTNDPKSAELIKTEAGVDKICKNSLETVDCIGKYMKKCGTPLQNELFKFAVENFNNSVDRFCKSGPLKTEFLKHSPCMHDKVISQAEYKTSCVEPMLSTLDETKNLKSPDDRLDASCCSYNRWSDCQLSLFERECGLAAKEAMIKSFNKAFTGISKMLCPEDLFQFKEPSCTKFYAKKGAKSKGKVSDNPVTKYMASYFAFLF